MSWYKTLNGTTGAYGHGTWSLPVGKRPGRWMPRTKPVLCVSGWHVTDAEHLVCHLAGEIYEVEVRGAAVCGDDKSAHAQARLLRRAWADTWTERTQRLFAVDTARIAVNRYAGAAERGLLHAVLDVVVACEEWVAWSAAESAARSAAWSAARSAAWSAAESAAWSAAESAARSTAWSARSAAESAARSAGSAARSEQADLLMRYLAGEEGPFVVEEA